MNCHGNMAIIFILKFVFFFHLFYFFTFLFLKVKKGLEKLYRRMEKDLTEEVGMLRVVWGSMQKTFMDQYGHFTKLIERCYPGANITLEFELKHVIDYFQSISDD